MVSAEQNGVAVSLLLAIFLFILGLAVGSFLNVCIYRIPRKESIISPSSHCPKCSHSLKAWENIPLLSYLILKGKCRYCKGSISLQYPLAEAVMGFLFLAIFSEFSLSFKTLVALFFVSTLFLSGVIDMRHKIIPNKIILPGVAIGFSLLFLRVLFEVDFLPLTGASHSVFYPLMGLVLGGGFLLIPALIKEEWMGGGDVKLSAFMGLFLGGYVLLALFLGSLMGAVAGITLILFKKLRRKETIPFGPFLALGAFITLFFGPEIFYFYLSLWF